MDKRQSKIWYLERMSHQMKKMIVSIGDPNVPCGQPTFRVDISMEASEVPVELQQIVDLQLSTGPEHFNIAKV